MLRLRMWEGERNMQLRWRGLLLGLLAISFLGGCNVNIGNDGNSGNADNHQDSAENNDSGNDNKDECEAFVDDDQWSQAIDCFTRRIDLDKKDVTSLVWRAYCYSSINNWPKCLEDAKAAIAIDPKYDSAYSSLGSAYEGMKDYANAEKAYQKAIELAPDDGQLQAQYASMLQDTKRYDEAIEHYTKAINLGDDDDDKDNYTSRGWTYLLKGDNQKAIADFDKVTALDKDYQIAYLDRAESYFRLHLPERAVKEYTQGLELDPDDFDSYLQRACTEYVSGDEKAAIRDFDYVFNQSGKESTDWVRAGLYEALAKTKAGDAAAAKTILAQIGQRLDRSSWPVPMYWYETKKIDQKQLLSLAISPEELTQAHAYIAWSARVHGDEKTAKSEFDWVKKNGAQTEAEFVIAEGARAN